MVQCRHRDGSRGRHQHGDDRFRARRCRRSAVGLAQTRPPECRRQPELRAVGNRPRTSPVLHVLSAGEAAARLRRRGGAVLPLPRRPRRAVARARVRAHVARVSRAKRRRVLRAEGSCLRDRRHARLQCRRRAADRPKATLVSGGVRRSQGREFWTTHSARASETPVAADVPGPHGLPSRRVHAGVGDQRLLRRTVHSRLRKSPSRGILSVLPLTFPRE